MAMTPSGEEQVDGLCPLFAWIQMVAMETVWLRSSLEY